MASLKSSVIWKFLERTSVQIISIVVQIVLARLIDPSQFGVLAILLVLYNLLDIFVQKGFGSALIRKKELSKSDIDTTFWCSLGIAILGIIIVFLISPFIAVVYDDSSLIWPLRCLSLCLIVSPFYCVYNSILVRRMEFKVIFIRGLLSSVLSGALGIIMALEGFGIWALIAQIVANHLLLALIMAIGVKEKIGFSVTLTSFKDVFSFGKNILMTEVLLYSVESLRTMFIGKVYTPKDLAFYDRGQIYPNTLMNALNDTFFSTLLPHFSKDQDNINVVKARYSSITRLLIFITVPIFFGFACISKEFVMLLLTEKWIDAVPFLIVFCIYQTIFPYQITSKVVLYALGDSTRVLRIEVYKSVLSMLLMFAALPFSPLLVAISLIFVRAYSCTAYTISLKRYFDIWNTVRSSFRPFLSSIIMFLCVYNLKLDSLNLLASIMIKIVVGVVIYVMIELIMDRKYVMSLMNSILKRNQ